MSYLYSFYRALNSVKYSSLDLFAAIVVEKSSLFIIEMAPTQSIADALRERFGSEKTIITLAEILSFLESHQKQQTKAEKQKQQETNRGTQQNASSKAQAREETRETRATPTLTPTLTSTSTSTTAKSQEITCQITCQTTH